MSMSQNSSVWWTVNTDFDPLRGSLIVNVDDENRVALVAAWPVLEFTFNPRREVFQANGCYHFATVRCQNKPKDPEESTSIQQDANGRDLWHSSKDQRVRNTTVHDLAASPDTLIYVELRT
jgi:hypothetical protein